MSRALRAERRCPRCREETRAYVSKDGRPVQLNQKWKPDRVTMECGSCGHKWSGRLSRVERDLTD